MKHDAALRAIAREYHVADANRKRYETSGNEPWPGYLNMIRAYLDELKASAQLLVNDAGDGAE